MSRFFPTAVFLIIFSSLVIGCCLLIQGVFYTSMGGRFTVHWIGDTGNFVASLKVDEDSDQTYYYYGSAPDFQRQLIIQGCSSDRQQEVFDACLRRIAREQVEFHYRFAISPTTLYFTISPDGRLLTYSDNSIVLLHLSTGEKHDVQLSGWATPYNIAWTTDAQWFGTITFDSTRNRVLIMVDTQTLDSYIHPLSDDEIDENGSIVVSHPVDPTASLAFDPPTFTRGVIPSDVTYLPADIISQPVDTISVFLGAILLFGAIFGIGDHIRNHYRTTLSPDDGK